MNRKARLLTVGFCDFLYLLFIYFLWYFFSKDTKFIVFVKSVLNLVLFLSLSFDLYYLWRTMHLIELCSNVYQMWISCYLYCHFLGGRCVYWTHMTQFLIFIFRDFVTKSRHWDVAIFLHSSNFCAMVLQCVYCILLFLLCSSVTSFLW